MYVLSLSISHGSDFITQQLGLTGVFEHSDLIFSVSGFSERNQRKRIFISKVSKI